MKSRSRATPATSRESRPRDRRARSGARSGPGTAAPILISAPGGSLPAPDRLFTILAALAAAVFCGVALYFILGPHRVGDYMTETDFYGDYAKGARLVQHGQLIPSRYGVIGPGYEIALAFAGFIVRDLFLAAELLSLAATLVQLGLWFGLLRRRASPAVGLFAVLFLVTNATFLRHSYSATTDATAIALQSGALFLLLTSGAGAGLGLAGLLAGLAFLTRYNAIVLVPAGLVAIAAGGTAAPGRLRAALAFASGFAVPVVPWVLYSLAHGGSFAFQLHHNIAYEVFARARGIPWDDYQKKLQPQFHNLWDVIHRDPKAVFGRMAFNVFDHLRLDAVTLLTWPVALCAAIGIALGARDGTLRKLWPVWLTAGLLFLTLVPVFYSERYSLALLPAYTALAGIAFGSPVLALAVPAMRNLWLKPWLAALPLAAAMLASQRVQARMVDQLPVEVLAAADTLKRLRQPGDQVIARKSHIAWHGGVEPLAFPFADSLPDLARYAAAHHARWLYFSWPEAETRPALWYLLDTSAVVPGLTPRAVTGPHPAVLYEIGPGFGERAAWMGNDTLFAYHKLRAQIAVDAADPTKLYNFAMVARMLGRTDEARGALEHLALRHPEDVQALVLLGDILLTQQHPAEAGNVFDRALAQDPANVIAGLGRGWALLMQGQTREAAEQWRPLIGRAEDVGTLSRMVAVYQSLGDPAADQASQRLAQVMGRR